MPLGLPLGCGAGPVHAVKLRASSDLFCPNNKIDVSDVGSCKYQNALSRTRLGAPIGRRELKCGTAQAAIGAA